MERKIGDYFNTFELETVETIKKIKMIYLTMLKMVYTFTFKNLQSKKVRYQINETMFKSFCMFIVSQRNRLFTEGFFECN